MPRLTSSIAFILIAILCLTALSANAGPTIHSAGKMPLAFTKNMGQWDDRVLFRTSSGGATIWITKDGLTYQFTRRINTDNTPLTPLKRGTSSFMGERAEESQSPLERGTSPFMGLRAEESQSPLERGFRGVSEPDSLEQLVITAKFIDANPNPEIIADGEMEYKCNYFLGNDPAKWHTNVPNFEAVTLKDLYPGVDLKLSSDINNQATYEFISAPNADISKVKVTYEGCENTSVDADGRTVFQTRWGAVTTEMTADRNSTKAADLRFLLLLPSYDPNEAALPDGQTLGTTGVGLSFSTFLGGEHSEHGLGIAVDVDGCAYVVGYTRSSDFPTSNAFQETYQGGYYDVFVTKMSTEGSSLIYSTFVGGEASDNGSRIAVDASGNAYITGWTLSPDFPTENAFDSGYNGGVNCGDVFVAKLSSSGNNLIYSTYLGGGGDDRGNDIAVAGNGNAYVTGWTCSTDFPATYRIQTGHNSYADSSAFVAEISNSGNGLVYNTCLGGANNDEGFGIAMDRYGSAYVVGFTDSPDFPTSNAFQTDQGGRDAFMVKLANTGDSLIYGTYFGGSDEDIGRSIAVDTGGNACVTGRTLSSDLPTLNPYQATLHTGNYDAFVVKMNNSGTGVVFSTYLGGWQDDLGEDIALDRWGNVYLTGITFSFNFPTLNYYQTIHSGRDAFVTKLSSSGSSLVYSTWLGGDSYDEGYGISVDCRGNAYVTGYTQSSNFPVSNPYQGFQGYYSDAFVTKFSAFPAHVCGDADGNGIVDIAEVFYLIRYIFTAGAEPYLYVSEDVDCSGAADISDAVYLINYIFSSGPAPCSDCQ